MTQPKPDVLSAESYADAIWLAYQRLRPSRNNFLSVVIPAILGRDSQLAAKVPEGFALVPISEIKEMAACLMLPDNGVCDTIWMKTDQCFYGLTLFDNLVSLLGDSVDLNGSVEEQYEILTGREYPASPKPTNGD